MFFSKVADAAKAKMNEMAIFSDKGKIKLQQVSALVQGEITRLELENPPSVETIEALNILRKMNALIVKLVTLNIGQLSALGALESRAVDANKPIEDLSLEELVQDLLFNRDIYWDIKNKQLHASLTGLFNALKIVETADFSLASKAVLHTIGGIEKIQAVGIILSALLPFYQQAIPFAELSDHGYHPAVDKTRLPIFRQELFRGQDDFLKQLETAQDSETQRSLCKQYRLEYQSKVMAFLEWVMRLPGGDVFLDTDNHTFKEVSVRSFNPQAGIFRGLLQTESSLNKELQDKYPQLYPEGEMTFLLDTTYRQLTSNLASQDQLLARRQALFTTIETDIITPFSDYITENQDASGLAQDKATLLKKVLGFIYDTKQETFFNANGSWRTAKTVEDNQLYMCFELELKLLAQLIAILKEHDALCKKAGKGVGRTGLLLAHAIEKITEHLAVQYDFRLDDNFLSALSGYEKVVGISPSQTSLNEAPESALSSGSKEAEKAEEVVSCYEKAVGISASPTSSNVAFASSSSSGSREAEKEEAVSSSPRMSRK